MCSEMSTVQLVSRVTWDAIGEESAALKDENDCHLFTVKLILFSLPSAFVYGKLAAVAPCYFVFVSLCFFFHVSEYFVQRLEV